MTKVLVVEDERAEALALRAHLQQDGHRVEVCETGAAALARLADGFEVILADQRLPDVEGLDVFRQAQAMLGEDAPTTVILTAYGTVEDARDALKAGVFDYLTKPVDPTELRFLIKNILDQRRLRRENQELSRQVRPESIQERILGDSPAFRSMLDMARSAAESEATILIRGESGTGKELVAEFVHECSPRREEPLVKVNCGAIPEGLLEAELFGHEKGAFTDAKRARKGRFELANHGTIFLDEIGEMSPALQVKLLRVLQEHELERLGGQGQVIPLDLRLVAATNQDLEAMVEAGTFRQDLYYRVNVITIEVPPLRDRPEDVALLAESFCQRYTRKNKRSFRGLSKDAKQRLLEHHWPGNVRELENVIERAVVLGRGDWILPEHLDGFTRPRGNDGASSSWEPVELADRLMETEPNLDAIERQVIERALRRTTGNVTQAARLLGLTRRTLQYRMDKHDIIKP